MTPDQAKLALLVGTLIWTFAWGYYLGERLAYRRSGYRSEGVFSSLKELFRKNRFRP